MSLIWLGIQRLNVAIVRRHAPVKGAVVALVIMAVVDPCVQRKYVLVCPEIFAVVAVSKDAASHATLALQHTATSSPSIALVALLSAVMCPAF